MKKILFIILISCLIIIIYTLNLKEDKYIFYIGDYILSNDHSNQLYNYSTEKINTNNLFVSENFHITDIINMIRNNLEINNHSVQNELIKADVIIVSIGMNDYISVNYLNNKKENFLNLENDYRELFEILRKYSKEKILLIGVYDHTRCDIFTDELIELNEFLIKETELYNIDYIDIIFELKEKKNLKCDSIYPTSEGYQMISKKITDMIDK